MAPAAHIDAVYGTGLDDYSLVSDYARVASLTPVPNVVTNSWGGSEDAWWNLMGPSWQSSAGIENEMEQLAAMGSTVLFSSADDAGYDTATGLLSPSFPATSPYTTSVGGTRTTVGNATMDAFPAPAYTVNTTLAIYGDSESASGSFWYPNVTVDAVNVATVANESYWYTPLAPGSPPYGGGGIGLSEWFTQPWWQHGFTVADTGRRMSADIAAEGDFNESVYFDGAWNFFWGGTSFACPTVAGEIALLDTYLNMTLGPIPGAHSFYTGLINPLLYNVANDYNLSNMPYQQISGNGNLYAVQAAAAGDGWPGGQNWPVSDTLSLGGGGGDLESPHGLGRPEHRCPRRGRRNARVSDLLRGVLERHLRRDRTERYVHPHGGNGRDLPLPGGDAPYELWFSGGFSDGLARRNDRNAPPPPEQFTFTASTPGDLGYSFSRATSRRSSSRCGSRPRRSPADRLSIPLAPGMPSNLMGGFDMYNALWDPSYPAFGPIEPNNVIVQVDWQASPTSPMVPVTMQVLGQTSYGAYWDSPAETFNAELNLTMFATSTNTSLTRRT